MASRRQRGIVIGALVGTGLLFIGWDEAMRPVAGPHSALELKLFRADGELPIIQGIYFFTAGRCAGCHGHDPDGLTSVDSQGRDVNLVDDWRSTMMSNSARDPFFRAKAEHEVLVNPEHQVEIENKCL
ncbi:MAG: hypothetical protein KA941_07525, partial [Flavobacteriales bacterium]|nr:hypothetical protein [Flavobacteriales bacterium]